MIFLLVISYSLLACLMIAFMVFAVGMKNAVRGVKESIDDLSRENQEIQRMFRNQIGEVLGNINKVLGK